MTTNTTTPAEVFRTAVARDQAKSDELLAAYQAAKAGRSLADLGAVELRRACRKHEIWTAFELRREARARAVELHAVALEADARSQQLLADYRDFGEDDDLHRGMAQAKRARRTRDEIERLIELADI